MSGRSLHLNALFAVALIAASVLSAQTFVGGEFQVNSFTMYSQQYPDVAALPDGNFVVVWESNRYGNPFVTSYIVGQRHSPDGSAVGGEFTISETISDYLFNNRPRIDAGDSGFVVVWDRNDAYGSPSLIYGRRLGTDGLPVGNEFNVTNTTTYGDAGQATVALLPNDQFVVSWSDDWSYLGKQVVARRYNADGSPAADWFRVHGNGSIYLENHRPAVAAQSDNGFVVAWEALEFNDVTPDFADIMARRFDATGAADGGIITVNDSPGTELDTRPDIAAIAGDALTVVWDSPGPVASHAVVGRQLLAETGPTGGEFVGGEFEVSGSEYYLNDAEPTVDATALGFIVAWDRIADWDPVDPPEMPGVMLREFDSAAVAIGAPIHVNALAAVDDSTQEHPRIVTGGAAARGMVTWDSNPSTGDDGDGRSIAARWFNDSSLIFADGFERSNTSAWLLVVP